MFSWAPRVSVNDPESFEIANMTLTIVKKVFYFIRAVLPWLCGPGRVDQTYSPWAFFKTAHLSSK